MKVKKNLVFLVLILFIAGSYGIAAQKRPFDKLKYPALNKFELPKMEKVQTANGIKLRLIKTEKLPLVNMRILFKGGDVYEPSSKVGLAGITAQLLRIGGTKELKGDEVDQFLDSNGITISIGSSNDYYSVSLSCLDENLGQAVSILSKLLMEPAFDKEKLEETKTRLASSIGRRNDEPAPINSREFNKLIYGEKSPLAAVLEYEHLENITGADIAGNYKRFFAPDNMLVGVTGPVDMDKVKDIFEKYFGNWNHQADIPSYPQVHGQTHDFKVAFAEKSNLTQSYLSIGHLGTMEDFDQEAKIMVFNSIFSRGFTSRLFNRVRTKMGLTYGIGGGIVTRYLYPGKTYYSTFTKSGSTFKAVRAILDEIDIIRKEKVSEKELKDAQDYFINSFVFKYSTPERIIYQELQKEFYGLSEGYSEKLLENIKKVTADDVLEIAQKYLHPDKMIIFILGKEEELDGKLEELGKVKKIDISIKPPLIKIPPSTPETLEKGSRIILDLESEKYSNYKRIKSIETTLDMKMTMMGRTMPMAVKSVILYPEKRYAEISVMGMKIERIINGKKGLMKQMGQETPMAEKDIEKEKFGTLYDIFHSKDKYRFQYLWEKEIDGKRYDVVYIFDAQKNWKKIFINKETGFIEIEEKLTRLPGQAGVEREVKSDFRIINGVPFAFKSETVVKDKKVVELTVKEVKVNPKVDLSLFKIEDKK